MVRLAAAAAAAAAVAFASRGVVEEAPAFTAFAGSGGLRGLDGSARHSYGGGGGVARSAASTEAMPDKWRAGPVEVYSGQAQKALYLLKTEPMLFEPAVEEALEQLSDQREEEEQQQGALDQEPGKDTLALRRRMEEVRQAERARIVTELLYLKVCARFKQLQVPLIPTLRGGGDVKFGALDLKGLTTDVYSKDALELVREHLFRIIGQQGSTSFMGGLAVVQIALFQVGQVYAMSALFGYYLRRVDARFQLEKLAGNFGAWGEESSETTAANPFADDKEGAQSLKDYISDFGPEEVQRMTTVATVEAQMAMEQQVTALFGDLRVLKEKLVNALGLSNSAQEATRKLEQAIQKNEVESLRITSDDLRRLVLEAVAYGALLNDAEKQVDTTYELSPASNRISGALTGDDEDEGRYLPE